MSERLSDERIDDILNNGHGSHSELYYACQELKERRDSDVSGSLLSVCIDLTEEILLYPKSWDDPESLDEWRKRLAEIKARQ